MDLSTFYPPFFARSSFPPSLFPLSSHRSCNLLRFPPSFVSFSPLFCLPLISRLQLIFPSYLPQSVSSPSTFFRLGFALARLSKSDSHTSVGGWGGVMWDRLNLELSVVILETALRLPE